VAADLSLAEPAPPFKLSLDEFRAWVIALDEAGPKRLKNEFKPSALAYLQRLASSSLPKTVKLLEEARKDLPKKTTPASRLRGNGIQDAGAGSKLLDSMPFSAQC
jgi:hypothetical protein